MTAVAEAAILEHDDLATLAVYAEIRDPSVLEDLIARHQALVQATCWQILGNRGLADDAVQETFVLFLRHAAAIRSSVPGWLHRTATTTARQIHRREAALRKREAVVQPIDLPCHPGDDVSVEVHELLGGLAPDDRDLIIRHYLMGQSQQSLAESLGVSQSAISRRLEGSLEWLRERLPGDARTRRMACLPLVFGFRCEPMLPAEVQTHHQAHLAPAKTSVWLTFAAVVSVGAGAWWWMGTRPSQGPITAQAGVVAMSPTSPTLPILPPPVLAASQPSIATLLRWERVDIQVEGGQATIVQVQTVPPALYLEADWELPLREAQDSLIKAVLVSDLPQVPLSFDLNLFYQTAGALSFCDPVQRDPALMPKDVWTVAREPFVSNPAAGPFPGSWHALHAEVTFQTDASGHPVTEIRRWCDGVEYGSTRHPGHPTQLILVELDRGTGQIRDLSASRLTPPLPF